MSLLQNVDYAVLAPLFAAGIGVVAVLLADLVWPLASRAAVLWVAVAGAAATLIASLALIGTVRATFCTPATTLPGGVEVGESCSYEVDQFTVFFLVLLSAGALIALLGSVGYVRETELPPGEYGILILASLAGGLTLAGARDLITLLVGLETLTLPTYVLVGLHRRRVEASEAAVKYLLSSITATAVMLLGMALVYGVTGSVHLDRIATALDARDGLAGMPLTAAAVIMVLAGFGFKVAAVPFHWWAPDVYQGAPVPVAAYLATVSKAGGIAGLLLMLLGAFPELAGIWGAALAGVAAATMLLGNLVALRQTHVVRLLAWSSVAHAGYLLVPLGIAAAEADRSAELVVTAAGATAGYLALYVAMNMGAFLCVTAVARQLGANTLQDYRGLATRSPWLGAAFAFFLICLAGLPPGLAGLVAKVVVLRAALLGGAGWLAVVMAVATVIGLAYYLRLAALLYRAPVPAGTARLRLAPPMVVALAVVALVTIALGFAPEAVLGAVPFAIG